MYDFGTIGWATRTRIFFVRTVSNFRLGFLARLKTLFRGEVDTAAFGLARRFCIGLSEFVPIAVFLGLRSNTVRGMQMCVIWESLACTRRARKVLLPALRNFYPGFYMIAILFLVSRWIVLDWESLSSCPRSPYCHNHLFGSFRVKEQCGPCRCA